jgi:hypothetical protein
LRDILAAMRRLPVALLALIALAAAFRPTADPDAWWHLAVGRAVVATRSTLPVEPWSSLHAGAPWRYKDLAADLVLYGAQRAAGFAGLWLVKALVGLLVGLALLALARRRAWWAVALAGAWLAAVPLSERPSLFSLAAFAAIWALGARERPWAAAGVAWAWVWLHRAFPLGFALLFAQALARPRSRSAWIAALAAPIAGLLNPCGLAAYRTAFGVAGSEALRRTISEWQPVGPLELVRHFPIVAILAVAALLAAGVSLARRRRAEDARDLAITLALAIAVGSAARFVPFLALAAALTLARLGAEALEPLPRRLDIAFALLGVALVLRGPFRLGPDRTRTPAAAAEFAHAHALSGPVANSFELGGWTIWALPDARVLADGRNELVYPPPFIERAIRSEHDPAEFAALRAEDHATWTLSSQRARSHPFLRADDRWMLVFLDDAAAIWALRPAHPELESFAYRWLDPADVPASVVRAVRAGAGTQIAAELRRFADAAPESPRAIAGMKAYADAIQ